MTTHFNGQPTPDTLPLYLKDRVFVEYFNSFLMLPAFSNKVYFNADKHNFELVQTFDANLSEEKITEGGVDNGGGGVLASPSLETLYLTDDAMGPVLEPRQSWIWVIQHRLPLFIKSDLYAEYKLSQILLNSCSHFIKQHLRNLRSSIMADLDKSHREKRRRSAASGRLVRRSTSYALSATPSLSHRPLSSRPQSCSQLNEEERILTLCSKSGMGLFRKFLDGKPGEKNWLFWMDAEQMAHLEQHDLTRHLNVMQDRFLRPGGSLELSSVLKANSNTTVGAKLTPVVVNQVQSEVEEGLKTYWYPRFLVHYLSSKQATKTTNPSLNLPALNKKIISSQQLCWEKCDTVRHPCKSATPTFRRFHVPVERSHCLQRAQTVSQLILEPSHSSSPRAQTGATMTTPAALFTPVKHPIAPSGVFTPVPASVNNSTGASLEFSVKCKQSLSHSRNETVTPTSNSNTRLLWTRGFHQNNEQVIKKSREYCERPVSSAEHFSNLAKYCKYPVIVSGRPATVHGHTKPSNLDPISCTSCCQILSVSGTPVHYGATQHKANRQDQYLALLRCLTIEHRKAGGYFQQYLETLPNQIPLRCLLLWRDVQEYKALFVGDGFLPSLVEMKAKILYSCYIVEGSPSFISCPIDVSTTISHELWPAFEDLFDSAEEYVLGELMIQWLELCELEKQRFEKIQCATDLSKSLVTVEEELSALYNEGYFESPFKRYFHHSTFSSPSSSSSLSDSIASHNASQVSLDQVDECQTEDDKEMQSNEEKPLNKKNEEAVKVVSMADILKNPKELEHFKLFLNDNMAAIDLLCWMDIESFRALPVGDKVLRNVKAKHLKSTYFNNKYFFGPNSPANKEAWRQVISAGGSQRLSNRPKSPFFREAQKHIRARLEKKWVPMFISTTEYLERNVLGNDETGTSLKTKDRKRSDGNQFTASRDSILLRKLLHEQAKRDVFRQYIMAQAAEGTHPTKNMEFWLEVQRFKEMFHSHMNVALLRKKLNAVITCYLTPTKIEVDVPFSEADVIARKPFGPYIFREAQATVFRLLLGYWQDFQSFSGDRTEQELFVAISQLREEIKAQRNSVRQQEMQMKIEEDAKKQSVMRFETEAERKTRLAHEKERREFGEVAVEFRLSCPQPQFDYCGRIAKLLQCESDDNLDSTIDNMKERSQLSSQTKKPASDKNHAKTKSSPTALLTSKQDADSLQVRFADHSPHIAADGSPTFRAHARRHSYSSKKESSVFFYS